MKYFLHIAGLLASIAAFFIGFVGFAHFLTAVPPEVANPGGAANMPLTWEAGYFNHGVYEHWYLISKHPIEFGLTFLGWVGGATGAAYFSRKLGIGSPSK